MTKATYKRRYLTRGKLTVSEGQSAITVVESKAAGRHGVGTVAESSHVICQVAGRQGDWAWSCLLKLKPTQK